MTTTAALTPNVVPNMDGTIDVPSAPPTLWTSASDDENSAREAHKPNDGNIAIKTINMALKTGKFMKDTAVSSIVLTKATTVTMICVYIGIQLSIITYILETIMNIIKSVVELFQDQPEAECETAKSPATSIQVIKEKTSKSLKFIEDAGSDLKKSIMNQITETIVTWEKEIQKEAQKFKVV